jgi:hypothetical protein
MFLMLGPESAYLFLDVYWLIFSGHILHICISRVMNRFGQSIIQLIKTLDVDDDLLMFLQVCHGFEQTKSHRKVIWRKEVTITC